MSGASSGRSAREIRHVSRKGWYWRKTRWEDYSLGRKQDHNVIKTACKGETLTLENAKEFNIEIWWEPLIESCRCTWLWRGSVYYQYQISVELLLSPLKFLQAPGLLTLSAWQAPEPFSVMTMHPASQCGENTGGMAAMPRGKLSKNEESYQKHMLFTPYIL